MDLFDHMSKKPFYKSDQKLAQSMRKKIKKNKKTEEDQITLDFSNPENPAVTVFPSHPSESSTSILSNSSLDAPLLDSPGSPDSTTSLAAYADSLLAPTNPVNNTSKFNQIASMNLSPNLSPMNQSYTVSEITTQIKRFLQQNFSSIWIKGEVSEVKVASSGHMYFTIKDKNASLSAVMFYNRARRLKFNLEPGTVFNCFGNITVYEKRGNYQLVVEDINPEGEGSFELAFRQLKEKLEGEGLFDPSRKKPIPKYPERVGLITSDRGAALKDILKTINVEYPEVELTIFPVPVQGEGAAPKIARMIELINQNDWVDLLILTRGGGSREDLWTFNEEVVARAIYASELPLISAVGHEVDLVISDLVADHRSSTPTEAANFICQSKKNLDYNLGIIQERINRTMDRSIMRLEIKLKTFSSDHWMSLFHSKINHLEHEVGLMRKNTLLQIKQKQQLLEGNCHSLEGRLLSLSPKKVLERGFALITQGDKIITDLKEISAEEEVSITLKKNKRQAKII